MESIGVHKGTLAAKLKAAQAAEEAAHGKYAVQFKARKEKAKQYTDKLAEADKLANELRKLDEEIAPIQQEVAPFGRRRYSLERAMNALPLLLAMEPFAASIGTLPVDIQRKTYKLIPPVVTAIEQLARKLKDEDGKPIMGPESHKLTSRVWDAVTTECNVARLTIKQECQPDETETETKQ